MTPEQKKGADGTCPTMQIKGEDDKPVIINVEDFDPSKHEKYEEDAGGEASKTPAEMNKAELIEHLKSLGVAVPAKATKDELLALVPAAQ